MFPSKPAKRPLGPAWLDIRSLSSSSPVARGVLSCLSLRGNEPDLNISSPKLTCTVQVSISHRHRP